METTTATQIEEIKAQLVVLEVLAELAAETETAVLAEIAAL